MIIVLLVETMSMMDMRNAVIAALFVLAMMIALAGAAHAAAPIARAQSPQSAYVNIKDGGFMPDTVTIAKGGFVIWTNTDNSVNSLKFDSYEKKLRKGDALTRTYQNPGTYTYLNGVTNKAGKIVVT